MYTNILVFDIETIPDVEAGKRLYHIDLDNAEDIANTMFQLRREQTGGSDFLRHYLQQIVAISVVAKQGDKLTVWSLGNEESSEAELIQRFFSGLEKYTPTLVSWNGSGFDLPVLHYRAMKHGISAPRYWDTGQDDNNFKWNNYINRYHERHLDLMDVLASYQMRAYAPLDEMATLLGFPGKLDMSGAAVWERYLANDIKGIRDYCETDVLNTYLVYLRFELMRGHLNLSQYNQECDKLAAYLETSAQGHFSEFLNHWTTRNLTESPT